MTIDSKDIIGFYHIANSKSFEYLGGTDRRFMTAVAMIERNFYRIEIKKRFYNDARR